MTPFKEYDIAYQSDAWESDAPDGGKAASDELTFPGYDVIADQKVKLMPVLLLRHEPTERQ